MVHIIELWLSCKFLIFFSNTCPVIGFCQSLCWLLWICQSVVFCWLGYAAPLFFSITSYLRRKPAMIVPSFRYLIVSSHCFLFVPLQAVFLQHFYLCHFHLSLVLLMGFSWCNFFCLNHFHNCNVLLDLLMIFFPCRTWSFHDDFKMTLCTCALGNESWSIFLNYGYPVSFWYLFV